jgi:hypothetical protein
MVRFPFQPPCHPEHHDSRWRATAQTNATGSSLSYKVGCPTLTTFLFLWLGWEPSTLNRTVRQERARRVEGSAVAFRRLEWANLEPCPASTSLTRVDQSRLEKAGFNRAVNAAKSVRAFGPEQRIPPAPASEMPLNTSGPACHRNRPAPSRYRFRLTPPAP